ncbi:MAG: hypothetical protein ACREV4_15800 [Gammaproteobacteria bacterium]
MESDWLLIYKLDRNTSSSSAHGRTRTYLEITLIETRPVGLDPIGHLRDHIDCLIVQYMASGYICLLDEKWPILQTQLRSFAESPSSCPGPCRAAFLTSSLRNGVNR